MKGEMNTNKEDEIESRRVFDRPFAADRKERMNKIPRCEAIVAALLIGAFVGYGAQLQRPGEAIDAGDSYSLKDGSRVVLHRLVNEAAVKHIRSKSVEPIVRQAGITREPLITIDQGGSSIVDVYSGDSQTVAELMNV